MADARTSGGRVRAVFGEPIGDARVGYASVRTVFNYPADQGQASSIRARALWGGSGGVDAQASQIAARILYKTGGDRRELRAWTFKQDDHEFYGVQLGNTMTLVYDKSTDSWCQWRSPELDIWRAVDVTDWEGINLACDPFTGKLWHIDPDDRLDYGDTPIVSTITGGISSRMRKNIANYMAELSLSEGRPPEGFDDGSVGLTLRTSDDGGQTYTDHGEITGEGIGEDMTVRWYGLGLIPAPGRIFEITDTGYARRIDGLNAEVEDDSA
jgi:hypothetical protein